MGGVRGVAKMIHCCTAAWDAMCTCNAILRLLWYAWSPHR